MILLILILLYDNMAIEYRNVAVCMVANGRQLHNTYAITHGIPDIQTLCGQLPFSFSNERYVNEIIRSNKHLEVN